MAYWPAQGNDLSSIDYSRIRIGIVHYYCKHQVVFTDSGDCIARGEHIFAYVSWKQRHPHEEWSVQNGEDLYKNQGMKLSQWWVTWSNREEDFDISGLNFLGSSPGPLKGRRKGLVHTECTCTSFFCKIRHKTYQIRLPTLGWVYREARQTKNMEQSWMLSIHKLYRWCFRFF